MFGQKPQFSVAPASSQLQAGQQQAMTFGENPKGNFNAIVPPKFIQKSSQSAPYQPVIRSPFSTTAQFKFLQRSQQFLSPLIGPSQQNQLLKKEKFQISNYDIYSSLNMPESTTTSFNFKTAVQFYENPDAPATKAGSYFLKIESILMSEKFKNLTPEMIRVCDYITNTSQQTALNYDYLAAKEYTDSKLSQYSAHLKNKLIQIKSDRQNPKKPTSTNLNNFHQDVSDQSANQINHAIQIFSEPQEELNQNNLLHKQISDLEARLYKLEIKDQDREKLLLMMQEKISKLEANKEHC